MVVDTTSETGSDNNLLKEEVRDSVVEHVNNRMPIRLLKLPGMQLVERSDVVEDIMRNIGSDTSTLEKQVADKMRLGTFNSIEDANAAKQEVIQDFIQKFAGYAILSHTWLQNEREVLYTDATSPGWPKSHNSSGAGYRKLEGFCQIASGPEYGVSFAWIDTLCINKISTSELDESIRSMYRWYLDSSICIAYLAETSVVSDMKRDRWFTRGWTLQEYLAPKNLKFYNKDWMPLSSDDNDKIPPTGQGITAIQLAIQDATGIRPFETTDPTASAPRGHVIRKLCLAAKRVTMKQEDRAYSLMGIFGVSFPIAYGEGGERAFFRLIEAILASKPADQVFEVLAWGGKPISDEIHTSRLIPSSPECYLGHRPDRESEAIHYIPVLRLPPEPTMLTHIGLRVRLLLIPVRLVPADHSTPVLFNGVVKFEIRVARWLQFTPVEVHLQKKYPRYPKNTEILANDNQHIFHTTDISDNPHFYFGVYTFIEDNHRVHIPSLGFCFLLGLYPPKNFVIKNLTSTYLTATSKIDTQRAIRFQRLGHTDSAIVEKERLAAEGMKLETLYL
ncbi:hypothetical protein BDZ97DRAFT_1794623 [Flammula alnicola]|nr:hypothetical protein BDZ97DRAFT_1794623 [Flammula alnicola]